MTERTFAEKISDWKGAIEARISSMISTHNSSNSAHSNLFSNTSKVTFSRSLNNGTRIGTITIDGTSTDIFCETDTNTTYNTATASANGLMSAEDKVKLNNLSAESSNSSISYISIDDDFNLCFGYDTVDSLTVSANKNEAETGETIVFTATVKDNNNNGLESVPISFYDGNTLIDSVTSNSNGVATFNYSSESEGNKTITAKTVGDKTQSVNLIIGPIPLFRDIGVTGYSNISGWEITNASYSIDSNGTTIEVPGWGGIMVDSLFTAPICIEFDVVSTSGTYGMSYYIANDDDNAINKITATGHYRFEVTQNGVSLTIDNGEPTSVLSSSALVNNIQVGFYSSGGNNSVKYKNFIIDEISGESE